MIAILQLRPVSTSDGFPLPVPPLDISMSDGAQNDPSAKSVSIVAIYISEKVQELMSTWKYLDKELHTRSAEMIDTRIDMTH